ncbi:GroES-like protein [Akanthomyces lecanii RCEF 1005]|uniref:GroES-like protein n=1 Tax=Akanthomyces lecanii RCEF 1005 TaxID=1081108 RepID=A0A168HJE3_CORDF|nr:GroES-like protein [Akanthomyces lecanii RCEF 1005]
MALNCNENQAAWLMGANERVKVNSIQNWTPGPGEIRVLNEVISLNPVEAKIQNKRHQKKSCESSHGHTSADKVYRFNMLQLQFPDILGSTYAGIVTEIGPGVTSVACGDRVAVARWGATTREERFTSFQKYPLALEPIGGLAVKYTSDAGYEVVTTGSRANEVFVRRRSPASIIYNQRAYDDVVQSIRDHGPYDAILEATGTEAGTEIVGKLLGQTGGLFYSTSPSQSDSELPAVVSKRGSSYSEDLVSDPAHRELQS